MRPLTVIIILVIFLLPGCELIRSLPEINITSVTDITTNSAIVNCEIADQGSSKVKSRGVCWGNSEPTIDGSHTTDGTGDGSFKSYISGLPAKSLIKIRAYAINRVGIAYSKSMTIITSTPNATINIKPATNITATSATLNAEVNANDYTFQMYFEFGALGTAPKLIQALPNPVSGNTYIPINADITGLTPSTTYSYCVKYQPLGSTFLSNSISFTTLSK